MHIQNNRLPRRGPLAVALATGLVMGGQASAQDPQEPQAGATLFPATELDRIVVTARKREESILEVPMNISVIGATELNDRNISSVQEIYRTIAVGSSPTSQLVLRGLVGGNTATPGTTSQFVDGIPFNFGNVFDIEQVEVLRGPQGTLWGSNAIGGTVQIHTRQPQFNDFEVFTTVVGEQEKNLSGTRTRTQAGMNIPLVDDTLAMRMVASISHTPGKIVNAATGNARKAESEFLRTQLRWQPTADMNVRFGHVWSATDTRGSLSADRSIAGYYWEPTLARNPASPWGYDVDFDTVDCPPGAERPACLAPSPLVRSNPKFTIYDTIDGWSRDTVNLFSLSLDHDNLFGFASAHYVGSYRKNFSNSLDDWTRLDMDDMARTWIINHDRNYRTTHELRFQNLERQGGLDWTLGFSRTVNGQGMTRIGSGNITTPMPAASRSCRRGTTGPGRCGTISASTMWPSWARCSMAIRESITT